MIPFTPVLEEAGAAYPLFSNHGRWNGFLYIDRLSILDLTAASFKQNVIWVRSRVSYIEAPTIKFNILSRMQCTKVMWIKKLENTKRPCKGIQKAQMPDGVHNIWIRIQITVFKIDFSKTQDHLSIFMLSSIHKVGLLLYSDIEKTKVVSLEEIDTERIRCIQ